MEVGHYHFSISVGTRKDGGRIDAPAKFQYIARLGEYANLNFRRNRQRAGSNEALLHVGSGNMPAWAAQEPLIFWRASQEFERANGTQYREFEASLPRGLALKQQKRLVEGFVSEHFSAHSFSSAIHQKIQGDGLPAEHVHIEISERILDEIERPPEQFFKRYNPKNPAAGGCKKDSMGTKERLAAFRASWAEHCNRALEEAGLDVRVDHRSYKDRGIDLQAEKKLAGKTRRKLNPQQKAEILEARQARHEYLRAHAAATLVTSIKRTEAQPMEIQNSKYLISPQNELLSGASQRNLVGNPTKNTSKRGEINYLSTVPATVQPEQLHQQLLHLQQQVEQLRTQPTRQGADRAARELQGIATEVKALDQIPQWKRQATKLKAFVEKLRKTINHFLGFFRKPQLVEFFPEQEKKGGAASNLPATRSTFVIEDETDTCKKRTTVLRAKLESSSSRRTEPEVEFMAEREVVQMDPRYQKLEGTLSKAHGQLKAAQQAAQEAEREHDMANLLGKLLLKKKLEAAQQKIELGEQVVKKCRSQLFKLEKTIAAEKAPQVVAAVQRLIAREIDAEIQKQELRDLIEAETQKLEVLKQEHEAAERHQAELLAEQYDVRQLAKQKSWRPT